MTALPPALPAGSRRRRHPRGTPPRRPCDVGGAGVLSGRLDHWLLAFLPYRKVVPNPLGSWSSPPFSPIGSHGKLANPFFYMPR